MYRYLGEEWLQMTHNAVNFPGHREIQAKNPLAVTLQLSILHWVELNRLSPAWLQIPAEAPVLHFTEEE